MRSLRYLMLVGALVAPAFAAIPAMAQVVDDPIVSGSVTPETLPNEVDVDVPTEVRREVEARGEVGERGAPVEVGGEVEVRGETLAITGGDVVALVVLGAIAIGLGALLVARARRRSRLPTP